MGNVRHGFAGALVFLTLCGLATAGVMRTWDNDLGNNDWWHSMNWDPNGGPDFDDTLMVPLGSPDMALGGFTTTDDGSVTVLNPGTTLSFGAIDVGGAGLVGGSDSGSLLIAAGARASGDVLRVYQGSAVVDGPDSELVIEDVLWVQDSMTVQDGGAVTSRRSHYVYGTGDRVAKATVEGTGSTWLAGRMVVDGVDVTGEAELRVENGGSLVSFNGRVGEVGTGVNTVTVDGIGSVWQLGEHPNYIGTGMLEVGYQGKGALVVQNGGAVLGEDIYVGRYGYPEEFTSSVTVQGSGSTFVCDDDLYVGYYGAGSLALQAGGSASVATGYIGEMSGSRGSLSVDGGSMVTTGDLEVGNGWDAVGSASLDNGGALSVGGYLAIQLGGSVILHDGVLAVVGSVVAIDGVLDLYGGCLSFGTYHGNLVSNGANICPGLSVGSSEIYGSLEIISGGMEVEIIGPGVGEYDQVIVRDEARLGGTLRVSLLDGVQFNAGDEFVFLTAGVVTSEFDDVFVPLAPGGQPYFSIEYEQQRVYLVATRSSDDIIPEPTTLSLLALGALAILRRRRRSTDRC